MDWLIAIVGGYLLGDLFSGMFHFWEDRYGNPDWPVLGKLIVQANIEHHRYPLNTTRRSYWYRNGESIIALAPFIAVAIYFQWWTTVVALVAFSQSNEIHAWAHAKRGRAIRFGQWLGVLQSPRHHAVHHQRPYDRNYCVVTNYLNWPLRQMGFWTAAEWVIWLTVGAKPNPDRAIY